MLILCIIYPIWPIIIGGDDYIAEQFQIVFSEGTLLPIEECISVVTIEDDMLEGDHDFNVNVEAISPEGAVDNSVNFTVTITDNDGLYFVM